MFLNCDASNEIPKGITSSLSCINYPNFWTYIADQSFCTTRFSSEQPHYGTYVLGTLDNLQVQCNDDESMASFTMRTNHGSRKIFYEMKCCQTSWVAPAQEMENALTPSGTTKELARQNVQCPNNAAIIGFRLEDVAYGSDWKYVYT